MPLSPDSLLTDPIIRAALKQAWQDSRPDVTGGHEEGGFIVRNAANDLNVVRWPLGTQYSILVSPHDGCKINGVDIIASFHTHPNTGLDVLQEPSETDKRAVRNDPDLKSVEYIGEFVLSDETVYLITPDGRVREISDRQSLLGQ